jgi:AraC-like DNA-binding protein
MFGIGIIGCGKIAQVRHIPEYAEHKDARLVGFYDINQERAAELAKQYIEDNISHAPDVREVADYCGISTKQLTRLFKKFEDTSPGEYIIGKRVKHIEKLLADPSLSLKQISIIMNFENEYYFNTFFKKHSGMPPGEYRKMLGK